MNDYKENIKNCIDYLNSVRYPCNDWKEDKVYFECVLNIYADRDTEVSISATDTDNVKMGLLDSPELTGIDKSDNDETFALKAGENKVTVLFEGKYAGIPQIFAREIPRFIEVKTK